MVNRSGNIGTAAETAVVRHLIANGFPHAERRRLRGAHDRGDITGIPGVVIEVKGGNAARTASDGQITAWLAETETERVNDGADVGLLVVARKGIGAGNAGRWWAVLECEQYLYLAGGSAAAYSFRLDRTHPVRIHLADAVALLRAAGYGDPIPSEEPA